jgi:branched-chain amino acid transport system substrate-binding protein
MYHFRVSPNAKPGAPVDLELVKEIKPAEMNVPIRNKR